MFLSDCAFKICHVEQRTSRKNPWIEVNIVVWIFFLILSLIQSPSKFQLMYPNQSLCSNLKNDRQMKGEDLQGLDLQELIKLEAMIECGLIAVVKTKVRCCLGFFLATRWFYLRDFYISLFQFNVLNFQGEKLLKEISTLKKKVMFL